MNNTSRSQIRISLSLAAVFISTSALASAQEAAPKEHEYRHVVIGDRSNAIHMKFSAPVEKKHRELQLKKALEHQKAAGMSSVGFAVTATNLVYGSGPVMRNPTNYLIFWQPPGRAAFPAGYQAGIEKFFQNVGGTPFYNIVTQYSDSTGLPVPNATSLGAPSYTDTTTAAPSGCNGTSTGTVGSTPNCPLTDGDIQNEVTVALAANPTWLPPGNNVEYFVFTPSDVGECSGKDSTDNTKYDCFASSNGVGTSQLAVFCAYHSFFNGNTIYAYQPFASNGSCYPSQAIQDLGYPNGKAVDVVVGEVSHEMIESNTDPLLKAWLGTGGGDDEIGDKCNFIDGYVAPDGTNIVLNGNRFKIQEEFSNDITACTKRYGPTAVTVNPGPVGFGEVQAGTSAQKDVQIQNNGQGDLNILNIRMGNGSAYYSLVNGQPTAATLHSSEGETSSVIFAPASGASFGSPTNTLIVDTDETPCPTNSNCSDASITSFANITGTVGVTPDALCANATVPTDPNLCTAAVASVNNGSFDPDGEGVTISQTPAGPYTLGTTPVTLNVIDNSPDHASASCPALVTVKDMQPPSITCPAPKTVQCTSSSGAMATVKPTVFDNCPAVTSTCAPASGSTFAFGTTPVTCTATDASGNMNSCNTSVTVVDVPPVISSVVASPNVLRPPNKKLDPVSILVKDTDVCDPNPVCSVTSVTSNSGPLVVGSDYVINGPLSLMLRAAGNGGHALTYIVTVTCRDAHGGATSAQTTVQAPL